MTLARVVGNIWATQKHPALQNGKLLLVQPIDAETGEVRGAASLAVDNKFGAGPGDTVLLLDEGGAARQILNNRSAPVRLVVCGIVDSVSIKNRSYKYH